MNLFLNHLSLSSHFVLLKKFFLDDSHQELDGMNKLTSDSYLVYSDRSPTTEEKRHGTHVSAIALGERDGSGMHGVAFDAQLFFISIKLGTAGEDYEPAQIDSTVDYTGVDDSWSQLENYFFFLLHKLKFCKFCLLHLTRN